MNSTALFFTGPGQVELRTVAVGGPDPGRVLVRTLCSAISAGTELLIYRGQFPKNLADSNDSLSTELHYPLQYGYASVGRVVELGDGVDPAWQDRRVFSFSPHVSHFHASLEELVPVPDGLPPEGAAFLPNMETAVNLVQDAEPLLGECVLILGQGVVGLLTAALLRRFPVELLVTADRYALRRQASAELGAQLALNPAFDDFRGQARGSLPAGTSGFDLSVELSGNPSALDDAIALTAFSGRIVVGSWYGEKRAPVDLGGSFHRSRISLLSSQVSTISPKLSGRWSKRRRLEVAWGWIRRLRPEQWVTHRLPISQAAEAYRLLDQSPEQTIQVILDYT